MGVVVVVMFIIAGITSLAVPVAPIMWIGHLGPFAKHGPSTSSIAFGSTHNRKTNYAGAHGTPTTPS